MKINLLFLFFALMCIGFTAQAQSPHGIDPVAYRNSFTAFEVGKTQHHNSYEYTISFGSFSGYWQRTTFVVKNGQVTERRFESGHEYDKDKFNKKWVETAKQLGSHKDEGEPVRTMDDIYKEVKNWLGDETDSKQNWDHSYFFEVDKAGILSTAGFNPNNCADDCFNGYHIRSFKWL